MPQMMPLNWLTDYMYFYILFLFMMIINFYMYMYAPKFHNIKKYKKIFSWKW